jgi:4-amino-4-deoxy-L-arabinose transferase-like glycosyltransferase
VIRSGEYLVGAAHLAAVVGLCAAAAVFAIRRALPRVEAAPSVVAGGLVFTAAFVAAHVLPLALGILGRGSVLAAAALAALAARLVPRGAPAPPRPAAEPTDRVSGTLAAAAALAVAVATAGYVLHHATEPSTGLDMVNIHLPDMASWIQSGTLWHVYQFVPRLAHGNYPNNGDMVLLGVTLPWRNDFAVRLAMLPWLGLAVAAIYALARELRAPAGAALLAAAGFAAIPIVAESAVEVALPDTILWAAFAGALVFVVRHVREGRRADLVLAGVGLGLAFGTKWYGVYAVAIAVLAWLAARAATGGRVRDLARELGSVTALIALGGGIWLVRNWVESGNPVFPVRVAPFGVLIFDAPHDVLREQAGYTVAGYVGSGADVWRHHLLPAYRDFLGPAALALAVGALGAAAGAIATLRRGRGRDANAIPVLALAGAAVLCAVAYALTPYSAQGGPDLPVFVGPNTRYAVPALIAAAGPAAWALGRTARWGAWAGRAAHGLVAVALLDGIRRSYAVMDDAPLAGAAAVAVVAAGFLAARRAHHRRADGDRAAGRLAGPLALGAGAAVALAASAAGGWHLQQRFNDDRYRGADATFDWVLAHAPAHRRIALAGDWSHGIAPVFPMFGPRLRNHVAYAGEWRRHRLDYAPGGDRFLALLRAGRYDLLVVGRGFDAAPGNPPAMETREERWARTARLRQLARSDTLTLYAVR